jgi:hypothetical protein
MEHEHPSPRSFWRAPSGWVLLGFLAIAAFYLLTEHTAHVMGALPYLLLLACPAMHLLHHRHHDHRHDATGRGGPPER